MRIIRNLNAGKIECLISSASHWHGSDCSPGSWRNARLGHPGGTSSGKSRIVRGISLARLRQESLRRALCRQAELSPGSASRMRIRTSHWICAIRPCTRRDYVRICFSGSLPPGICSPGIGCGSSWCSAYSREMALPVEDCARFRLPRRKSEKRSNTSRSAAP